MHASLIILSEDSEASNSKATVRMFQTILNLLLFFSYTIKFHIMFSKLYNFLNILFLKGGTLC